MNDARKARAVEFAREVMVDEDGLAAVIEVLEFSAFQRWRQTEAGEGWRKLAGELAAIRELGMAIRGMGKGSGNG